MAGVTLPRALCEMAHNSAMKPIVWVGSSKDDLRRFPMGVRSQSGFQLDKVQRGGDPDDWKPMPSIGPGVREIRIREAAGAFRVIYVAQIGNAVHVLHCFQKKTERTSLKDLRLAQQRLREVTP